MELENSNMLK